MVNIDNHFTGPDLPFKVSKSAMILNADGDGVLLIGGWNGDESKASNAILELRVDSDSWTLMENTLAEGRQYPLAFAISPELSYCGKYS